jgi:hypothetical protein
MALMSRLDVIGTVSARYALASHLLLISRFCVRVASGSRFSRSTKDPASWRGFVLLGDALTGGGFWQSLRRPSG